MEQQVWCHQADIFIQQARDSKSRALDVRVHAGPSDSTETQDYTQAAALHASRDKPYLPITLPACVAQQRMRHTKPPVIGFGSSPSRIFMCTSCKALCATAL